MNGIRICRRLTLSSALLFAGLVAPLVSQEPVLNPRVFAHFTSQADCEALAALYHGPACTPYVFVLATGVSAKYAAVTISYTGTADPSVVKERTNFVENTHEWLVTAFVVGDIKLLTVKVLPLQQVGEPAFVKYTENP